MDDNKPLFLWTINERGKIDRRIIKDWKKVVGKNGKDTFYRFKDKLYRIQEINEKDLNKYRYHRILSFNGSYDFAWRSFSKALCHNYIEATYKATEADKAYNDFKEKNRRPIDIINKPLQKYQ